MEVGKTNMEFQDELVGKIVKHKLLGRCIITKAEDKYSETKQEYKWEIRDKNGLTLVVDRRELEEKLSKATILRQYAHACKQLVKMVEAEAKSLEDKDA